MIRDMTLIQKILQWAEKNAAGGTLEPVDIPGYPYYETNEHVQLCLEADLIAASFTLGTRPTWFIHRLTWKGHEHLHGTPT